MFLHVGADVLIRQADLIGIFDIDNMNTPPATKEFLRQAEKKGLVKLAGNDLPKSFVVTCERRQSGRNRKKNNKKAKTTEKNGQEMQVILCRISAQSLYKRAALSVL